MIIIKIKLNKESNKTAPTLSKTVLLYKLLYAYKKCTFNIVITRVGGEFADHTSKPKILGG